MNCLYGCIYDHPLKCICIFFAITIKFCFGTNKLDTENSIERGLAEYDLVFQDAERAVEVFEVDILILKGISFDNTYLTESMSSFISLSAGVDTRMLFSFFLETLRR